MSDTPRTDDAYCPTGLIAGDGFGNCKKRLRSVIYESRKLETELATKDALLDDFCKWAFAHPPKRPDHACKYCVPNGPIVKADWMCCYHKAMKRLEESN